MAQMWSVTHVFVLFFGIVLVLFSLDNLLSRWRGQRFSRAASRAPESSERIFFFFNHLS